MTFITMMGFTFGMIGFVFALISYSRLDKLEKHLKEKGLLEQSFTSGEDNF